MPKRGFKDWGDVFHHYVDGKGFDHGYAAYRADQWRARMNKQTPRIVFSPLGKRWYVVTRYSVRKGTDATTGEPNDYIVASVKYDVTDQMAAILSPQGKKAVKRGKTPVRVKAPAFDAVGQRADSPI